jgi:zinc protease
VIDTPEVMARPPAVGALPPLVLPPVERLTLANRVPAVTVHREVAPIVSLTLMFRSGSALDPRDRAGLASITAEMLDEGAGARDALAIADELEQLGADLWVGSGRDGSQLSLQAPRASFEAALAIAADVLLRPRLAEADWHRVVGDRRTALGQRRDQPEAVVNVVSDRLLFGDAHPYGLPSEGLERTLDRITLEDARAFHAAHYRPNDATLVVAGDFDRARLAGALEDAFGAWTAGPTPAEPVRPPLPERPRLVIVDRPGAPQSVVRLVAPGFDRLAPERPGLSMLNAILGGSFTSRLNFNLREQNGFTYGAASSFAFLRYPGSFAARAAVFAESTGPAVREMLAELAGMHERPVTVEEHAKARATQLMRVAEGLATSNGIAGTFGEIGLYGLELDEPARFVAAIERTTRDDLQALAARTIDPNRATIVIVGDRAAIEPGLRALGLPAAVLADPDGNLLP